MKLEFDTSTLKLNLDLNVLPINRQIAVKRAYDNITQSELAEKLGLAQSMLSRVETGSLKIPRRCRPAVLDYLFGDSLA